MLIANKYEIPDKCPDNCKFKLNGGFSQGSICTRCPIFNCKKFIYHYEVTRLVEPEDYREDWAEQWFKFFNEEIENPVLKF